MSWSEERFIRIVMASFAICLVGSVVDSKRLHIATDLVISD